MKDDIDKLASDLEEQLDIRKWFDPDQRRARKQEEQREDFCKRRIGATGIAFSTLGPAQFYEYRQCITLKRLNDAIEIYAAVPTMKSKKLRNFAFTLHRYIGLAVGLILVIVGLTGSVLVFANEIEHIQFVQQFGTVVPQGQMLSPTSVVNTLKVASDWEPNTKYARLYIPITPDTPYVLDTESSDGQLTNIFVNPYAGTIIGKQGWNEQLIASEPLIRAITLSPQKLEPASQLIANQLPLKLANQLKTSQAELPDGKLRAIDFPQKPDSALIIHYNLPEEFIDNLGLSKVYLDQYSGKVLRVDNSLKASLGSRVLNSFFSLHYGTFGGLPTRILYVFVGLAPLILFVTGFVMWRYRYKGKNRRPAL